MSVLTAGRKEIASKDVIGGIKKVFIFPFIEYAYTLIVGVRGQVITSFPATDIYEFAITGGLMNETINNDDEGLYYDQSLTFTLKKQDKTTTYELNQLTKYPIRYIVQLNDGRFKIGGLYNGSDFEFDTTSGGAKNELNGYNVTIKSKEEWQSAFIDDLSSSGFTISQNLLLEDFDGLLTEDELEIILE